MKDSLHRQQHASERGVYAEMAMAKGDQNPSGPRKHMDPAIANMFASESSMNDTQDQGFEIFRHDASNLYNVPQTRHGFQNNSTIRISCSSRSYSGESVWQAVPTLVPLQLSHVNDHDRMSTVMLDDPKNFDLIASPSTQSDTTYMLETQADLLFSTRHLKGIFENKKLFLEFSNFIYTYRPEGRKVLAQYLDSLKALHALKYANTITNRLGLIKNQKVSNQALQADCTSISQYSEALFGELVNEELPAYIADIWIHVASESIYRRITGTLPPHLREFSEGVGEVFCLTDPSRHDNPIVFVSEEFARTTHYGTRHCIGRNCRFLQGPRTSPHSVRRLKEAVKHGKEHTEVFLNYRRDGQPFLNLLMFAPLHDSQGVIRYFIGAQIDISGLVKDCTSLEAFRELNERKSNEEETGDDANAELKDGLRGMVELFNEQEVDEVRKHAGTFHNDLYGIDDQSEVESMISAARTRLILDDTTDGLTTGDIPYDINGSSDATTSNNTVGQLKGVYKHYLLVRPAPSLRILFTSPSLRIPGILQSSFVDRIGGSSRIKSELIQALHQGRGVTAKIHWLIRPYAEIEDVSDGRPRWVHCTPLLNHRGQIGVWMIILLDVEIRMRPKYKNQLSGREKHQRWENTSVRETRPFAGSSVRNESRSSMRNINGIGYNAPPRPLQRPAMSAPRVSVGGSILPPLHNHTLNESVTQYKDLLIDDTDLQEYGTNAKESRNSRGQYNDNETSFNIQTMI